MNIGYDGLAVESVTIRPSPTIREAPRPQLHTNYEAMSAEAGTVVLVPVAVENPDAPCSYCMSYIGENPREVGFPPFHRRCRCYVEYEEEYVHRIPGEL